MNNNLESLEIYDEIPYEDEPFASTHPQTLASIATLFGLSPAPPDKCRYLELGAAKGKNIIGMANSYPNSKFIGIDLSLRQVSTGNKNINLLGLKNVELIHADILNLDSKLGKFDYISAHGILSWVPPIVRDKIFKICGTLLNPNGVCYLSYNTYPGWKARDIFRDIMLFEGKESPDTHTQVQQARLGINITASMISDNNTDFAKLLKSEIGNFQNRPDWYYVHDFIATNNQPFYIHEIFEKAKNNGLQYLADTELSTSTLQGISPNAQNVLKKLSNNLLRFEQYSDIARFRSFRRSLLCLDNAIIDRKSFVNSLSKLLVASNFEIKQPDPSTPTRFQFIHRNGGRMEITDPLLKNTLCKIAATWPKAIPVSELLKLASNQQQSKIISDCLIHGIFANLIEIRVSTKPSLANTIPEKPLVSKLAREQAKSTNHITSLLHHTVVLEPNEIAVMLVMDGTKSVKGILDSIQQTHPKLEMTASKLEGIVRKFIIEGLILE